MTCIGVYYGGSIGVHRGLPCTINKCLPYHYIGSPHRTTSGKQETVYYSVPRPKVPFPGPRAVLTPAPKAPARPVRILPPAAVLLNPDALSFDEPEEAGETTAPQADQARRRLQHCFDVPHERLEAGELLCCAAEIAQAIKLIAVVGQY